MVYVQAWVYVNLSDVQESYLGETSDQMLVDLAQMQYAGDEFVTIDDDAKVARYAIDPMSRILDYESGEMEEADVLGLFARLVRTGQAWTLQGHYGRTAAYLIEAGAISPEGEVL